MTVLIRTVVTCRETLPLGPDPGVGVDAGAVLGAPATPVPPALAAIALGAPSHTQAASTTSRSAAKAL